MRWLILASVWLLYFSFGLIVTALAPLVAPITNDLQMSHTAMGSVLGAWQLVYIASAVPCGAMLDRLGPHWALLIGAALMALSGVGRGLAVDHSSLFLAVALFGLGGPIISAGAPKVISLWFTGAERGLAMGIYMTGPALGGIIALSLSNSIFLPLLDGNWRSLLQLWGVIAGLSGLIWWLICWHPAARAMEHRLAAEPRVPQRQVVLALLKVPAIRVVLLMSVGIFILNHGLNNWLPELLRDGGMNAVSAGYWAAVPTAAGIVASLLIPRLATPLRRFAILIALCAAMTFAVLFLLLGDQPWLSAGLILQGIARGALMTITILALVEMPGVGERHAGTASGLFFSAAEVGGVCGPVALGILYDVTAGFDVGLGLFLAIALLLMFGAVRLSALQQQSVNRRA